MYFALHIVHSYNISFFEDLLDKDKGVSIHVKNLQKLITNTFNVEKSLPAPIVSKVYEKKKNVCDLQNLSELVLPKLCCVFHSIEIFSYHGHHI